MSRWLIAFSVALAVWVGLPKSMDAAPVVNGNLDDWGIAMAANGHNVYAPSYGNIYLGDDFKIPVEPVPQGSISLPSGLNVSFAMEDTSDTSNNYQVGPLYGGQNYDAEFLGINLTGNILSVAISSGQRPDNRWVDNYHETNGLFAPGDLVIKTVGGTFFGVELGGGAIDSGMASYAQGSAGYTYNLNTSGYTQSWDVLSGRPVGSLWRTSGSGSPDWEQGIQGSGDIDTQLVGGTRLGIDYGGPGIDYTASVYVNFNSDLGQHAWMEIAIDTSLFGASLIGDPIECVRWAPSCANDQLALTAEIFPNQPVPEPASFLIWGILGLIGVVGVRLRRR